MFNSTVYIYIYTVTQYIAYIYSITTYYIYIYMLHVYMNQAAVFGWLHNSVLDDIQRDDGLPILLWSGRKNLPIFRAVVHFCCLRDLSGVIRNANDEGWWKTCWATPLIKSGWGFLEIRVLQNMGGANVPFQVWDHPIIAMKPPRSFGTVPVLDKQKASHF